MQLNPARGRKLFLSLISLADCYIGLCSSTPRGDGNLRQVPCSILRGWRFMQLNPARGRKHGNETRTNGDGYVQVYAAQPREGTETCCGFIV